MIIIMIMIMIIIMIITIINIVNIIISTIIICISLMMHIISLSIDWSCVFVQNNTYRYRYSDIAVQHEGMNAKWSLHGS